MEKGLILLDKPKGPLSHQITSYVKDLLKSKKAGHAGTLDPNVSGVLPIAIGKDTKMLRFLAKGRKEYVCAMETKDKIESDIYKKHIESFIGTIFQIPPKMSAVSKKRRKREIYNIKVLEIEGRRALFRCEVEAGTYIRVLCEDIGKKAGTIGRMIDLRRTASCGIRESECITLQELEEKAYGQFELGEDSLNGVVKNIWEYIPYKKIVINEKAERAVRNGAVLMAPGIEKWEEGIKKGDLIRVFSKNGFVGVARTEDDIECIVERKKGRAAVSVRLY